MTMVTKSSSSMATFIVIWAGQLISALASAVTHFGLTIWAYQVTGKATALGIISAAFVMPLILLSPFAGVLVDRHNRKLMMMVSDLTAVTVTVGVFFSVLFWTVADMAPVYCGGDQWPGKYFSIA